MLNLFIQKLANWMIKCGFLIQPLINLMYERAREGLLIHMFGTALQVFKEARDARGKQNTGKANTVIIFIQSCIA